MSGSKNLSLQALKFTLDENSLAKADYIVFKMYHRESENACVEDWTKSRLRDKIKSNTSTPAKTTRIVRKCRKQNGGFIDDFNVLFVTFLSLLRILESEQTIIVLNELILETSNNIPPRLISW